MKTILVGSEFVLTKSPAFNMDRMVGKIFTIAGVDDESIVADCDRGRAIFSHDELDRYFTEVEPVDMDGVKQLIYNGAATIVYLEDGSKGVAKCNPEDTFNRRTGAAIAKLRAQKASINKQLDTLCRD